MIKTSLKHWNKVAGILRPRKSTALLLDRVIPLLRSLDLRVNVDLRDALIFTLSFSSGARAMEVVNITWKDVTVLDGGKAVVLNIRPTKNTTEMGSTHSAQFGRRLYPEVCPELTVCGYYVKCFGMFLPLCLVLFVSNASPSPHVPSCLTDLFRRAIAPDGCPAGSMEGRLECQG